MGRFFTLKHRKFARGAVVIDAFVIFPHQLFATNETLVQGKCVFLVEDALYFKQFRFHQKKLALHRASMRAHAVYLQHSAASVVYLESAQVGTMDSALGHMAKVARTVHYIDPVDDWLERRLLRSAHGYDCTLIRHGSEMFINDLDGLRQRLDKRNPSMAAFYAAERKRLNILMVDDGLGHKAPVGGRWSFDTENRRRLPAKLPLPRPPTAVDNEFIVEARQYVSKNFPDNPGQTQGVAYPVTHADARVWLTEFLERRLVQFGPYEDAISATDSVLFHSVLTPMLNTRAAHATRGP